MREEGSVSNGLTDQWNDDLLVYYKEIHTGLSQKNRSEYCISWFLHSILGEFLVIIVRLVVTEHCFYELNHCCCHEMDDYQCHCAQHLGTRVDKNKSCVLSLNQVATKKQNASVLAGIDQRTNKTCLQFTLCPNTELKFGHTRFVSC